MWNELIGHFEKNLLLDFFFVNMNKVVYITMHRPFHGRYTMVGGPTDRPTSYLDSCDCGNVLRNSVHRMIPPIQQSTNWPRIAFPETAKGRRRANKLLRSNKTFYHLWAELKWLAHVSFSTSCTAAGTSRMINAPAEVHSHTNSSM